MMNLLFKISFYIFLCVNIFSCIGKVEDKNPDSTKNAETGSESISFAGVNKAIAISHDKVELSFLPASGSEKDMTYLINVNDSSLPIEVKGESLNLSESGSYIFVVNNLNVNSTYTFSVGVKNSKTGSITSNDKSLTVKTFGNFTASFSGVAQVGPVSGEAGQTSVTVSWIPANSLGSTFSPRATDPVAYEIAYLSSADGGPSDFQNSNNPNIIKVVKPASLGSSPQLSSERERVISGLIPGVKYYFRVRAIHRAYVDFKDIDGYQYEQNNIILSTSTLSSTGLFDWDTNSFTTNIPDGELALSKIDLRWQSATGPYFGYRLYNIKVGEPSDDIIDVEANAPDLNETKINELNALFEGYESIVAVNRFYRIENLESYAYYKVILVACRNESCAEGQRILSNSILYRVTPKIAPFAGLLKISNPDNLSSLNQIKVSFDAPVITSGYINKFELYCFENETDSTPSELLYNIANASGKSNCDGLIRKTESPLTYNGFSSFTEITIEGNYFLPGQSISDKVYCFGAIPVIEGVNFTKRDLNAAIVRCRPIEIKVPTMTEFPGVIPGCNVGADSINVSWNAPTGGIFDKYELFYKSDDGNSFNFSKAISGDVAYTKVDNLSVTSHTINGLMPGKKYQYGILAYISGGTKIYSEINAGIGDCQIPYPVPAFEEWIDIFAIGPKADGRIQAQAGTKDKTYLFETLNDQGQPIEVEVNTGDFSPTSAFTDQFGDVYGSVELDGAYGSNQQNIAQGKHIYSNSGVVRIAWKDVTFNSSSLTMNDIINNFEVAAVKKDRAYGYKVYRSDNNQSTWKELTSKDYGFQTVTNSGLLHPIDYTEKPRPNAPDVNFKAVMFTDYSVSHIKNNLGVNRARIYYYKIVPVFNNIELKYQNEDTNPQHIIKVVLPPENMALVHRLMANRQTCLEVNKPITKDISKFYTCSWSGVGSRGLGTPWISGQTVYDFGESLLIDRFEMGCDYTRGDYANLNSTFSGSNYDFKGINDNAASFVGCLVEPTIIGPSYIGGVEHPGGSTYTDKNQFRVGDCIGDQEASAYNSTTVCADPDKAQLSVFTYPGIPGSPYFYDCTNPSNLAPAFFNPYGDNSSVANQSAQSEFGAVFYNRVNSISDRTYSSLYLRGADGTGVGDGKDITFGQLAGRKPSRCSINLPVQDASTVVGVGEGRLKSRWITANSLDNLVREGSTFSILSSTVSEVVTNANLYDSLVNAKPADSYINATNSVRYDNSSTIARIISSNDSKLPPLDGLNQEQANEICNNYEVEVGTLSDSNSFEKLGSKKNKRLMRRTEGLVAAAYPRKLDDSEILEKELGTNFTFAVTAGTSFNSSCNSFDRDIEDGLFESNTTSGKMMNSKLAGNIDGTSLIPSHPKLWSGSSFYDKNSEQSNTQGCTSRYGLQDIIGNMDEYSSEQIFCDFSGEKLYLGANGDAGNSVVVSDNINFDSSDLSTWVQSSPDTGRCSLVETGSNRGATYNNGGFHIPIFDIFGNLNSTMISVNSAYDNRAIGNFRNGDGFFLDFGQDNLGPPISLNDTLGLKNTPELLARSRDGLDQRRGRYFNPIIGLPLECPSTYCNDSTDNKAITTQDFVTDFGLTAADFTIADFPTGNSQIYSDGMSEISTSTGYYKSPDTYSYSYDYIDSITLPSTTNSYSFLNGGALKSSQDNDNTIINRTNWIVTRSSPMYFLNFGKSNVTGAGRYAAHIRGITKTWQSSRDTGFRCAVRLGDLVE